MAGSHFAWRSETTDDKTAVASGYVRRSLHFGRPLVYLCCRPNSRTFGYQVTRSSSLRFTSVRSSITARCLSIYAAAVFAVLGLLPDLHLRVRAVRRIIELSRYFSTRRTSGWNTSLTHESLRNIRYNSHRFPVVLG